MTAITASGTISKLAFAANWADGGVNTRRLSQTHKPLSACAKQSAVMALRLRRVSAQTVDEDLGVFRPSLYKWTNHLLSNEALATAPSF